MHWIWKSISLVLVLTLVVPAVAEDESDDFDDPSPHVIVVFFKASDAKENATAEKNVLAPMRKALAEDDVLFIEIDLSTKASVRQGRLLLGAMGMGPLYATYRKKAGTIVIWDAFNDRVATELTSKSESSAAIKSVSRVLNYEDEDDMGDG